MGDETVGRLRTDVVDELKRRFVGRDEVVDLIALAVVAGEHLFLYGPPGTAKSALIRQFASAVQGRYFEYLLTRFSEPNEIFGPIDLARLREGAVATVTTGMLPEAEFAFLDELFNANSAILNNLLTVLNERVYRRGAEVHKLPLLSLFSASNHLADDEAAGGALRPVPAPVPRRPPEARGDARPARGRLGPGAVDRGDHLGLGRRPPRPVAPGPRRRPLPGHRALRRGRLQDPRSGRGDLRPSCGQMLKLLAASALLSGRDAANPSDLWVLRYVWDRVEQVDPLAALINGVLDRHRDEPAAHPLAAVPEAVDPEDLARQIEAAEAELEAGPNSLAALARLRERAGGIADRSAWVVDEVARRHLLDRVARLLARVGA